MGARTWHKAEASVCGTLAQVVMPQKVAGAAGGGGGRSTCASTVEAAQRSDMALLTTMAADVADILLFSQRSLGTHQRRQEVGILRKQEGAFATAWRRGRV